MQITVVLPTYNESANIVGILRAIHEAVPTASILVVDDNSPDGTGRLAEESGRELGRVRVLHRSSKEGLGSAYRFGFSAVLSPDSDSPERDHDHVIVTMDSDFSHDPLVIPVMVDRIQLGADAVVGSRYVAGGGTVNWPLHRRMLSKWGNRYTARILDVSVRDCTTGFRAYRASALRGIDPQSTRAEGYAFLTELVVRLSRNGFRVDEVPILFSDRRAGTSKMSARIIAESMTLVTRWGISHRLRQVFRRRT